MKKFEEWTWDELIGYCTWMVMQGIANGKQLKDTIHTVIDVAIRWRDEQAKKGKK